MSLLERVYFLHNQISQNRYPNSRTLMEEFEISLPTARRDFAYLRDRLLAPIEFDQKKNGFYYTEDTFSLPFENSPRIVFLLGMLGRLAEETGLRDLPEMKQLEKRFVRTSGPGIFSSHRFNPLRMGGSRVPGPEDIRHHCRSHHQETATGNLLPVPLERKLQQNSRTAQTDQLPGPLVLLGLVSAQKRTPHLSRRQDHTRCSV